jgi:hypothetical protein
VVYHARQHHNREAEFLSTKSAPRLFARLLAEPAVHAVGHIRWSFRSRLKCFAHRLEFGVAGVCLHRRRSRDWFRRWSRGSVYSALDMRIWVVRHGTYLGCLVSLCYFWLAGLLSLVRYMVGRWTGYLCFGSFLGNGFALVAIVDLSEVVVGLVHILMVCKVTAHFEGACLRGMFRRRVWKARSRGMVGRHD